MDVIGLVKLIATTPMDIFTFEDYADITREEEQLKKLLNGEVTPEIRPSKETLENIKKYSEALSVRKTNSIGDMELLLN